MSDILIEESIQCSPGDLIEYTESQIEKMGLVYQAVVIDVLPYASVKNNTVSYYRDAEAEDEENPHRSIEYYKLRTQQLKVLITRIDQPDPNTKPFTTVNRSTNRLTVIFNDFVQKKIQ